MLKKLLQFLLFVVTAVLIAGLYGIIHNQATYTISNEYFTHFKFLQFGLPDYYIEPKRLGAGIVGWSATWWVGLIIGFILGGLWIWEDSISFGNRYKALKFVCLVAFMFGIIGTIFAYIYYHPESYYEVSGFSGCGREVADSLKSLSNPHAFLRAGMVHNCSYLGGLVGLVFGISTLWKSRKRYKQTIR